VRNPDYMAPSSRNYWIITMLIINMIIWSVLCVGLMITFAATMSPLALMFSLAFGVGAWWMKRLMLDFHADLDHTAPPRLFRRHRRHAE
jgi:hypothetical protein